jgi:hypothetical protein
VRYCEWIAPSTVPLFRHCDSEPTGRLPARSMLSELAAVSTPLVPRRFCKRSAAVEMDDQQKRDAADANEPGA